jgi:hypothetical protein
MAEAFHQEMLFREDVGSVINENISPPLTMMQEK